MVRTQVLTTYEVFLFFFSKNVVYIILKFYGPNMYMHALIYIYF